MTRVTRASLTIILLSCPLLLAAPDEARAQASTDPGGAGPSAGGHSGRHGGGRRHHATPSSAAAPDLPVRRDPAQRLDPGTTLCPTEAALLQHEAAILARLNGGDGDEPRGCQIVRAMTAVAVVARHGPASTEVMLPGPPERIGWTDAAVRDGATGPR